MIKEQLNPISPTIVSLGDCMVLMNPSKNGSLRFVDSFNKEWAGAEANFLVGCNRLGLSTGFISAFAEDPFGSMIYHELKGEGINLDLIQWDEHRSTPLFFKQKKTNDDFSVFYYRTNTAGCFLAEELIDLDYFKHTKIFFFTGIFPALSGANLKLLKNLIAKLKAKNITLAFDPNIRLKLFKNQAEAKKTILAFLPLVDILLISDNEAKLLFETDEAEKFFSTIEEYNLKLAILKKGSEGAYGIDKGIDKNTIIHQKKISVPVVDTCGAGDAFDAGFIYGYLNDYEIAASLKLGAYTASFAVSSLSDNQNAPTLAELNLKIKGQEEIKR